MTAALPVYRARLARPGGETGSRIPKETAVAADNGAKVPSPPFDVRTIKDLVALMSRHELSEIDLREGEMRIRLRRGPQGVVSVAAPTVAAAPIPAPAAAAPADTPAIKATGAKLLEIKAPTPGTFYAAANPDSDAFVQVGTRVSSSTVVCIIEAMKIFNEIQAECSGVIREVCVKNQQPVEFEQVLFRVEPA
jgi:acetyl-CoA carboxylase biotin carboxyl carrier protein